MAGRVSIGGQEMDLQEAIDRMDEQLQAARTAAALPIADQLNATIRENLQHERTEGPSFELVNSLMPFDGEKPEAIGHFFSSLEDVGELSRWTNAERLRVAKLKITGIALKYIQSVDKECIATYPEFKRVLTERFSDKAPAHCYFQQLSVLQQRRGETIESFADRVRALNEKTIRVTDNEAVNAALREEAERRAVDVFVRGLLGSVGEHTRLKFPTTMRGAITTAVAVEHLLRSSPGMSVAERKVFRAEVTCYQCHEKGHISRECPKGMSSGPSNANANQDRNRRSPMSRVTCWRCRKPGHIQKDCRVRLDRNHTRSGNDQGPVNTVDMRSHQ